ncbi:MAG TPA: acetolactate synthase small subunit [Dehalococcoidia bacterium]|nr:acetolactate synthase small subunit [Dehalococcoidia bacterium]
MKHTVVAMVEDRPGVLTRVASLFRRRGFNIDSLAVGATEEQGISRMTIVVDGDHGILQQVEHQLFKLIDVVKVTNLSKEDAVSRELALIKVRCGTLHRREVLDIVEIFRAQVIDVSPATLIIQVVAEEERLNALLDNLKPYGVMEMVRTGRIAMARGEQTSAIRKEESDEVLRFHTESGRRPEGKLPYVSK